MSAKVQTEKVKWYENYTPLPDISGIGFIKATPKKQLNLSSLIRRARFAAAIPLERRSTNDRIDMAVWNLTWRCLKRSRPSLAELIQDPFVKEMTEVFNAEIKIEL